jgi:hypothetical protein
MKKRIDGFEYELKKDSKIIGIVTEDKNNYSVSLRPRKELKKK